MKDPQGVFRALNQKYDDPIAELTRKHQSLNDEVKRIYADPNSTGNDFARAQDYARDANGEMRALILKRDREVAAAQQMVRPYLSPHFDNEPDVLAHMRMVDRTDPDGRRVLHLEETQSDYGQAGKKKGFKGAAASQYDEANRQPMLLDRAIGEKFDALIASGLKENEAFDHPEIKALMQQRHDAGLRVGTLNQQMKSGLPDAPFVESTPGWTNLALKRAMIEAARGNYDAIAWTPGAEQAKRFDLSKQIDDIRYAPSTDGRTVSLEAYRGGENIFNQTNMPIAKLDEFVGRDVAERIAKGVGETDPNTGYRVLSGLDLQVGGEGMKGYYDKILPTQIGKVLKEIDETPQFGTVNISNPARPSTSSREVDDLYRELAGEYPPAMVGGGSYSLPSINLTPQMREKINQGLPLFTMMPAAVGLGATASQMQEGEPPVVEGEGFADGGKIVRKALEAIRGLPKAVGLEEFMPATGKRRLPKAVGLEDFMRGAGERRLSSTPSIEEFMPPTGERRLPDAVGLEEFMPAAREPRLPEAVGLEEFMPIDRADGGKVVRKALEAIRGLTPTARLPMDQASRMQRAKEMGFDVDKLWYHSALNPIEQFDPYGNFMGRSGVSGTHLTDNPKMAERYLERYGDYDYKQQPFAKNTMPVFTRTEKVMERDEPFRGPVPMGAPIPEGYVSPVEKAGYDALVRNEAINARGGVKHVDPTHRGAVTGKEMILTDPSRIRSIFAAFDPEKKNSRDLLAGTSGAAVGLGATASQMQEGEPPVVEEPREGFEFGGPVDMRAGEMIGLRARLGLSPRKISDRAGPIHTDPAVAARDAAATEETPAVVEQALDVVRSQPRQPVAARPLTIPAPRSAPPEPSESQRLWQLYNESENPADFVRADEAMRAERADGGRLLEDQYPTQYLPDVGRQVMQDGGAPEDGVRNALDIARRQGIDEVLLGRRYQRPEGEQTVSAPENEAFITRLRKAMPTPESVVRGIYSEGAEGVSALGRGDYLGGGLQTLFSPFTGTSNALARDPVLAMTGNMRKAQDAANAATLLGGYAGLVRSAMRSAARGMGDGAVRTVGRTVGYPAYGALTVLPMMQEEMKSDGREARTGLYDSYGDLSSAARALAPPVVQEARAGYEDGGEAQRPLYGFKRGGSVSHIAMMIAKELGSSPSKAKYPS